MSELAKRKPNSPYTAQEIDLALRVLAMQSGNSVRAAQLLAGSEEDVGRLAHVDDSTLRKWRNKDHRERYEEIREDLGPRLKADVAETQLDLVIESAEVERRAIARLGQELDDLPTRDLPGAIRNLGVNEAMKVDKYMGLRGEATSVVAHISSEDLKQHISKLQRLGVAEIDGEAEEIPAED